MKLYLASRFADRDMLRPIRDKIFYMGHECTNTWLDESTRSPYLSHEEFHRKLAIKDLMEIAAADAIVRFVHEVSSTGGADTELGFALAQYQRKLIWIVGPSRNVFHTLADRRFDTNEEFLAHLATVKDPILVKE